MLKFFSNQLNRKRYHKTYFPIGTKRRQTPVEPWAFLRVKNEAQMLEKLLSSIEGIIHKGVLAYNPSEDHTEQVILNFCQRHPGFIPFCYAHPIIPAHSVEYLKPHAPEQTLAAYYNAALAHIPDGAWFIKLDADHIYDREKLKAFLYLPQHDNELIVLSRLNLHLIDNQVYIHQQYPYVDVGDSWMMKKTPQLHFQMSIEALSDGSCRAYERLKKAHNRTYIYTDCINLHFPAMYKQRQAHYHDWKSIEHLTQLLNKKQLQFIDPRLSHAPSILQAFQDPKTNFQQLFERYTLDQVAPITSDRFMPIYKDFLAKLTTPCAVIAKDLNALPNESDLEALLQHSQYYDILVFDQNNQGNAETHYLNNWKITPIEINPNQLQSACFAISYQAAKHILYSQAVQTLSLRIASASKQAH